MDARLLTTRVIDNNVNPMWNQAMHFVVARPKTSALDIVCKDKGRLSDTGTERMSLLICSCVFI